MTRLKQWRESNDYTLRDVADLSGLSAATISRVERGERSLRPRHRVLLARRLGVSVSDLFDVEPIDDELAATDGLRA